MSEIPPSNSPRTVKTRILIISDTHHVSSEWPSLRDSHYSFREPLPKADVLLHAGDLTINGKLKQNLAAVNLLRSVSAELKIVIPGNHDVTLDTEFYSRGKPHMQDSGTYPQDTIAIRELYTSNEAYNDGIRYMEEGVQTFTLSSGAKFKVYASAYTPEFCNWAFAYERDQDRYNQSSSDSKVQAENPIPDWPAVDILLTHGPPKGILDEVERRGKLTGDHVGCDNLMNALRRCRPRLHAFGHIHEGWGAEKWNWNEDQGRGERVKSWITGELGHDSDTENRPSRWIKDGGRFVDLSSKAGEEPKFGEETIFINASIMNVHYVPVNAPWVLDMELPLAKID